VKCLLYVRHLAHILALDILCVSLLVFNATREHINPSSYCLCLLEHNSRVLLSSHTYCSGEGG
jgi:hypothetical protein